MRCAASVGGIIGGVVTGRVVIGGVVVSFRFIEETA